MAHRMFSACIARARHNYRPPRRRNRPHRSAPRRRGGAIPAGTGGEGRAGWHIECSALALRELGTTIDLHGGGTDLIYPHHECEAVQSQAATGEEFVKHWMHVAMVRMDGRKMSKSRGNLVFVDKLLTEWSANEVRVAVLSHHYRTEWDWSETLMPNSAERLSTWKSAGNDEGALVDVRNALDDDL